MTDLHPATESVEVALRCGHTLVGVHPASSMFDFPAEDHCLFGCSGSGLITEDDMGLWTIDSETGELVSTLTEERR